ncbi:hypothetical protein ENSA5_25020 [Enhygromyxa salina]|uniref:Uncharacterized protein n=1 Tax=Enhygromyxa salina TaxID=215803 RepID=A0A2S9YB87_9BACT|nr:hypothetical protein [Enhygromyxa salina]PRQ02266.1 hypothetical protein ENSA5_25020 [Enhygromyxa salina]
MTTRIREARTSDLPELAALLGARAGLDGPEPNPRRVLHDLDPARVRAWVGVEGQHIVAMTCAELRRLQIGDRTVDAGYWSVLHVDDDHLDALPPARLAQTMLAGLAELGVEQVYRAGPLDLARAHPLGELREVSRVALRLKPLRPLSLLAKGLGWPGWARRVAEPLDRVVSLPSRADDLRPRRRPRATSIVRLSLPEDAEGVAELLARARAGRVTRRWAAEELCARYQAAADGGPYTLLGLCRAGALIGVLAYRMTTRETGARLGVIMELAARDDDPELLELLLHGVERRVRAQRADGVLLLDALGPTLSALARRSGYGDSGERFVLEVGDTPAVDADDADGPLLDADAWRVPLSDHDGL